jgi:hypothetical protein
MKTCISLQILILQGTLSIMQRIVMLSVNYAQCHLCSVSFMLSVIYAQSHILFMSSFILLNVVAPETEVTTKNNTGSLNESVGYLCRTRY